MLLVYILLASLALLSASGRHSNQPIKSAEQAYTFTDVINSGIGDHISWKERDVKETQTESGDENMDETDMSVKESAWLSDVSEETEEIEDRFEGRYFFNDQYLTWNLAAQYCRESNSHLAYPDTDEEAGLLEEMMVANGASQIHLGFHDMFGDGIYYTILGQPITDTCHSKWAVGYPVGGPLYNCGGKLLGTPSGLLDQSCNDFWPFICEKNLWWNYELKPGMGYYKLHPNMTSWEEALETCESEGAHLLILQSDEEYALLLEDYKFFWLWMGLHHTLEDREFLTIYGDSLSSTNYTRWASTQPSGSNSEFPHVMFVVGMPGLYLYDEAWFICKRDL